MGYRFEIQDHSNPELAEMAMGYAVDLAETYELLGYTVTVEDRGGGKFVVVVHGDHGLWASIRCVPTNE